MADGRGGSRAGGFLRGVIMGLIVCAIGAVALSLSTPPPERGAPAVGTVVPDGTAAQGALAPAPSPDVTVVPADQPTEPAVASPPSGEDAVAPQATFETAPPAGDAATPPAQDTDSFSAPQTPSTGQ